MAIDDSIINGIVTFGVLGASIWVYLYLEKRKYMQQKKIEVYSAMTTALKKWFIVLPSGGLDEQSEQTELQKEPFQKIGDLSEELLFYGSTNIYCRIFDLFSPIEGGSRINAFELNNLIIDMIKEIDPRREINPEEIYFFDEKGIVKFKKPDT